jgi:hypothetical protein
MNIKRRLGQRKSVESGWGKEGVKGVDMIKVHYIYMYENRIMKPAKTVK